MPRRASHPRALRAATLAASTTLLIVLGPLAARVTAAPSIQMLASRTYVVNSTADTADADVGAPACADGHGKCTLRAAIMQANFHPGADTITIPAGTFKLTRKGDDDGAVLGDLDITDSVTLKGAGSTKTIIDGNGTVTHDRVLQVLASAKDTTLTGLTIRNGQRLATFDEGGGLLWNGGGGGQLTLENVIVERNKAYYAGGLALQYSDAADSVLLDHVTVQRNTATAAAGGVEGAIGTVGSFLLRNSRVLANTAYEGGGLYLQGPSTPDDAKAIKVQGTVIESNHAGLSAGFENRAGTTAQPVVVVTSSLHANVASNLGGGLGNYGNLSLSRTTLEANTAVRGGALYDYEGGLATLTNATLHANSATERGGAVYVEYFIHGLADVALRSATLSGNASPSGGGIFVDPGANASLANTLIAKGATGANCAQPLGGLANLSDDTSCGFGVGDGIPDLELGPIGLHGGTTRTQVPKAGSPAVDAGTAPGAPTTDQRGIHRPMGTGVDVGAVEVCPLKPPAASVVAPPTTAKGPRLTLDWKDVPCVETYSVLLRLTSKTGKVVQSKTGLLTSTLRTKTLVKGRTYYWRVTAVGDRGTTVSAWHHVKVR
jgi:CSLREA domain-containing protein